MVAEIARDTDCAGLPISAIGGISNWRDAAEFMVLGAGSVQVCTAAMHKGFKIVEDMADGLGYWMDGKGYRSEEHTSELQSLMSNSYAVFCLKKQCEQDNK